jgi:predicted ester cyclase
MCISLEKNKTLIRRGVEALNRKDLTTLDEFFAPDYTDHTSQLRGLESIKQLYTMILRGFPDFHRTIEDIITEGDKVWVRYKTTGTNPKGEKIDLTSIVIHRIVEGKIVEGWGGPIQKISIPKDAGELITSTMKFTK